MSMSEYRRLVTSYQEISTGASLTTSSTGSTGVTLVTANASGKQTIFIQKLHVEITTGASGVTWSFQGDASGVNLVPGVSAAAINHFDFDFGPRGFALTQGKNFVVVPSATGAAGNISWEGYQRPTATMTLSQASI